MKKIQIAKFIASIIIVVCFMVLIGCMCCTSCQSRHYFSINAEEITNPQIHYEDSTTIYNPF